MGIRNFSLHYYVQNDWGLLSIGYKDQSEPEYGADQWQPSCTKVQIVWSFTSMSVAQTFHTNYEIFIIHAVVQYKYENLLLQPLKINTNSYKWCKHTCLRYVDNL